MANLLLSSGYNGSVIWNIVSLSFAWNRTNYIRAGLYRNEIIYSDQHKTPTMLDFVIAPQSGTANGI